MSLYKRIIPCLDVDNGRVVKGTNFINIIDAGDPVEVAKKYDKAGVMRQVNIIKYKLIFIYSTSANKDDP